MAAMASKRRGIVQHEQKSVKAVWAAYFRRRAEAEKRRRMVKPKR